MVRRLLHDDICFIPRRLHRDKPAVMIELKYAHSASGGMEQIKERQYAGALEKRGETNAVRSKMPMMN